MTITVEHLKSRLKYYPESGEFRWINGPRSGLLAGAVDSYGYAIIKLNKKIYKAHRLAFLYTHGRMPDGEIDHINHDKLDNRICNLRECSTKQNLQNREFSKTAESGVRGVYRSSSGNFRVRVCVEGKNVGFGSYRDLELAELVAREAREKLRGQFACHG